MSGFGSTGWGGSIASGGGGGGGPGPTVGNYVPPDTSQVERQTPLAFDVTPNGSAIANVTIDVLYPATGARETVYDGVSFAPNFALASARSTIAGAPPGQHFVISRRGGWPLAPALHGVATSVSGGVTRF